MAVFRVERNTGYTVMSNHHLRNKELTLKAKEYRARNLEKQREYERIKAREYRARRKAQAAAAAPAQ